MVAVGVMAMAFDDVVDVILVLDRGMTAARTMDVLLIVTFANVGGAGSAHVSSYGRPAERIP